MIQNNYRLKSVFGSLHNGMATSMMISFFLLLVAKLGFSEICMGYSELGLFYLSLTVFN